MTNVKSITIESLRIVVARATKRWPESRGRIERGALIVLLGGVFELGGDAFEIQSQSDNDRTYIVTASGCTCPDATWAPRGICKHRWATDLLTWSGQHQDRIRERRHRERVSADRVMLAVAGVR